MSRLKNTVALEVQHMLVKTGFGVLTFALLLTVVSRNLGQETSKAHGCAVLDVARAPQFITFEDKLESNIRLRLRNNTDCKIVVETDDQSPTHMKRLPTGGVRIEAVLDSKDGVRLPLHYLLQDRRREQALKPAYGWGDSVFVYEILPGQSIVFDVPAMHFKRRADIAVPFGYAWENPKAIATGVGGVVHRVDFLFEDLPPAVRQ